MYSRDGLETSRGNWYVGKEAGLLDEAKKDAWHGLLLRSCSANQ